MNRRPKRNLTGEGLLQKSLCAVAMLQSDLFRHRSMLDVDADDAQEILDHLTVALAILEPSYRGKTFDLNDTVDFDDRVFLKIPGRRS